MGPGDMIKYVKKHGFLKSLKHVFERLGFVSFSRTVIFLALKFKDVPNDISESYSFHIASTDDIQKEQNYYDSWFTKNKAVQRVKQGYRLFILKESNRILYYHWVEQNKVRIDYINLHLHIPQDTSYITGLYTLPEERGKGIASKIGREILIYLKKEGFNNAFLVIDPSNIASLKTNKKLGFKEYQTINYKRNWHIRYYNVQKYNSDERKTFITLFRTPKDIWKTFL